MSAARITVRLIGHGTGERHKRLRAIWKAIDATIPWLSVQWLWHHGSHAQGLATNFQRGLHPPEHSRSLVLTEEDFLPNLQSLQDLDYGPVADVVGCSYRMRTGPNLTLAPPTHVFGGWFLAFSKANLFRLTAPDFGGKDPGNNLRASALAAGLSTACLNGWDCMPHHYGIAYEYGVHLFWSRHLHDDPSLVVSGIRLGDVQECHDDAVDRYLGALERHYPDTYRHYYTLVRTSSGPRKGIVAP